MRTRLRRPTWAQYLPGGWLGLIRVACYHTCNIQLVYQIPLQSTHKGHDVLCFTTVHMRSQYAFRKHTCRRQEFSLLAPSVPRLPQTLNPVHKTSLVIYSDTNAIGQGSKTGGNLTRPRQSTPLRQSHRRSLALNCIWIRFQRRYTKARHLTRKSDLLCLQWNKAVHSHCTMSFLPQCVNHARGTLHKGAFCTAFSLYNIPLCIRQHF